MSRPRKRLPPNAIEIISDLASRGVKETELAKALGMSFETWKAIRESDQAAKQAWTQAKTIEHDKLVGVLFEKAMGGDSTAAMFLLKSRHGYRDNGNSEGDGGARVNLVFNLPSPLKPEQYSKLIEVHPKLPEVEKCITN